MDRSFRDDLASFKQNGFDGAAVLQAALDLQNRENSAQKRESEHQYAETLRELEEALRIEMATLGKDHPRVAITRNPNRLELCAG